MVEFDYAKLIGRIVEKCGTRTQFAARIGISTRSLTLKLKSKRYFTQIDIFKACDVLGINVSEIGDYFLPIKFR